MTNRQVIKLGGSCLSNPRLVEDLDRLVGQWAKHQNFVVVGGGKCIDAMRDLSDRFVLDQAAMHWRCVALLRTSFEVVSELMPAWHRVEHAAEVAELLARPPIAGTWLVAVDTFYHAGITGDAIPPTGWETTSDSIAAYLARLSGADQLLLVKSCPITTRDPSQLAAAGIVDQAFPSVLAAHTRLNILTLGENRRTHPAD
jgi:aspartokinase-like uncharacterized kinase